LRSREGSASVCPRYLILDAVHGAAKFAVLSKPRIEPEELLKSILKVTGKTNGGEYVPGSELLIKKLFEANDPSNITGIFNELRHANDIRASGLKPVAFGDSANPISALVNGVDTVADVDLISINPINGLKYYDDVKSTLQKLDANAAIQAQRLFDVAKAKGAIPRWVVSNTFQLDPAAVATLKSIGIQVLNSRGFTLPY
jgi:hypothetical protein